MAATIQIVVDAARARSGSAEASRGIMGIGRAASRSSGLVQSLNFRMRRMGASAIFATTGITPLVTSLTGLFGIKKLVTTIGSFEEQLAALRGVLEIPSKLDERFQALSDTAKQLGATTRFTATEVATAMTTLSRGGLQFKEVVDTIGPTLSLASAGQIDLAQSSAIVLKSMRKFGLETSQAAHVADVFVNSSNKATQTVEDLNQAFRFIGPLAKSLGISIDETAAALGVMADAGLEGTLAGTALRRILQLLVSPTKASSKAISDLGLTIADLNVRQHGIAGVFDTLSKATSRLKEPTAALFDIFKVRGAAGAAAMSAALTKLSALFASNAKVAGIAAKNAKIIEDTLPGAFRRLAAGAESAAIALGDSGLGGAVRSVVDTTANALRIMSGMADAETLADKSAWKLVKVLRVVAEVLAVIVAIKMAGFFLSLLNPITLATAALATLIVKFEDLIPILDSLDPKISLHNKLLDNIAKAGAGAANATGRWITALQKGDASAQLKAVEDVMEQIKKASESIALNVSAGNNFVPVQSFKNLVPATGEFSDLTDEIAKATKQYTQFNKKAPISIDIDGLRTGGMAWKALGISGTDAMKILGELSGQLELQMDDLRDRIAHGAEATKALGDEAGDTGVKLGELSNSLGEYMAGLKHDITLSRLDSDAQEVYKKVLGAVSAARESAVKLLPQHIRFIIAATHETQENERASKALADAIDAENSSRLRQNRFVLDSAKGMQRQLETLNASSDERERSALLYDLEAAGIDRNSVAASGLLSKLDELQKMRKIQDLANNMGDAFASAFGSFVSGASSAKEAVRGMIMELSQMILKFAVLKPLAEGIAGSTGAGAGGGSGLAGFLANLFGHGGIVSGGGPVPFKRGGIFGGPALMRVPGGNLGLFGERGPEGALPLTRLPSGDLGVKAEGSGAGQPTTNVFNLHFAGRAPETRRSRRQLREDLQSAVLSAQAGR